MIAFIILLEEDVFAMMRSWTVWMWQNNYWKNYFTPRRAY